MKFLDKKQYRTKVNFYRRDARDRESYLLDPSRYHTNALERENKQRLLLRKDSVTEPETRLSSCERRNKA